MTFGSFLMLLAVITATSMASVIAIRHIDTTFAELQRLQDVGDLAEEIDRRMNELRLAARDFVTDPGARSDRVSEAASELSTLLKKTRLELAPEQQNMIDGVTQRLANYRDGIERVTELIARRAELLAGAAAGPRANSRRRSPACRTGPAPESRSARRTRYRRPCWRTIPRAPSRRRGGCVRFRSTIRRCAPRPTPMPTRSSPLPAPKARSPRSTRRCWAPKAA